MTAALHVILASNAAAAEAARKSLFERFRVSDATHATRALTLNDLGIERTSALDELVRRGAVREASPGKFYLDEPTVALLGRTDQQKSRRATLIVVIVSLLLLIPILYAVMTRAAN